MDLFVPMELGSGLGVPDSSGGELPGVYSSWGPPKRRDFVGAWGPEMESGMCSNDMCFVGF
jgi:hypothetical protein